MNFKISGWAVCMCVNLFLSWSVVSDICLSILYPNACISKICIWLSIWFQDKNEKNWANTNSKEKVISGFKGKKKKKLKKTRRRLKRNKSSSWQFVVWSIKFNAAYVKIYDMCRCFGNAHSKRIQVCHRRKKRVEKRTERPLTARKTCFPSDF